MFDKVLMTNHLGRSLRANPTGDWPQVDPTAYIDPTARVIGKVRIGADVYLGPYSVVRADEANDRGDVSPIVIEPECNIQDGVIIHALAGTSVTIGRRTSLTHGCIIHAPCAIGQACFIGFRAVVYEATLGDGVFVGAGSVIQAIKLVPKTLIPPGASVLSKGDVLRLADVTGPTEQLFVENVIAANLKLAKGYSELKREQHYRRDGGQR